MYFPGLTVFMSVLMAVRRLLSKHAELSLGFMGVIFKNKYGGKEKGLEVKK